MSLEEEFFDVLYLGIFLILSSAFDVRFYRLSNARESVLEEAASAVDHFHALLHFFSLRFIVQLGGDLVAHSYVVDRMLCEFAACAVTFAKGIDESEGNGGVNREGEDVIPFSEFKERLEGILLESHPDSFPYYSRCLELGHKRFLWTGPQIKIISRTDVAASIIPLISKGELLDLPSHQIYSIDVDSSPTTPSNTTSQLGKRSDRGDGAYPADGHPPKRLRP
jgi:hypothetical protein